MRDDAAKETDGHACRPPNVGRTWLRGFAVNTACPLANALRALDSQREHGFLRLRLRQPCSRWLSGKLRVRRQIGGGCDEGGGGGEDLRVHSRYVEEQSMLAAEPTRSRPDQE
jgi:hypothetical protein